MIQSVGRIYCFIIALFFMTNLFGQTIYTGIFRSPSTNTTYHHLVRDYAGGAALYVNQVNSSPSSRILQLSSGTAQPAQGIKFTVLTNGRVGILTAKPDAELTVKGDIHAQEVKVDLNGAVAPDYVFEKEYDLKSLQEVKQFIKQRGHLPNIPSAVEMNDKGINLKELNLKLLEKIEELTLYTIDQEERLDRQALEIEKLKHTN